MLDEFRSTSITWDKATRRIYSPIAANASDSNGRKLNIQVVNSGQVENLTGATLHLYWETKDKMQHGLDAFTASDISKGEFEIFYTTGMLSNVGELNATLVLVDATGQVVSDWFKITVARGIDGDAIQSENSFTTLTQALIDISNLEQNYAPRLNDLTAQLQQKPTYSETRLVKSKIELQDLSESTLGAIDGSGGPFELLSIPQDESVTLDKIFNPDLLTGYVASEIGEALPVSQAGNYSLELESKSDVFVSNGNIVDLFGLTDGTYENNGITVTINGNEITVLGTATANTYFKISEGSGFQSTNAGLEKTLDNIPIMSDFYWSLYEKTNGGDAFTVAIRDTSSGNYQQILTSEVNSYDNMNDVSKVGQIYIFVASGAVVDSNFKMAFGNGLRESSKEVSPNTLIFNDVKRMRLSNYGSVLSQTNGTAKQLTAVTQLLNDIDYNNNIFVESHTNYFYFYKKGTNTDSNKWLRFRFDYWDGESLNNGRGWVLGVVDAVEKIGDTFNVLYPVVKAGEWEMAIRLDGRPDFIGCKQHGSELSFYSKFYVDGTEWIPDNSSFCCNEIKTVEKLTMYDPDDEITEVGTHRKFYTIDNEKINIKQRIEWTQNLIMGNNDVYVAMLPIIRGNDETTSYQITDKAYNDDSYEEIDVSLPNHDARTALHEPNKWTLYSNSAGISASVKSVSKEKLPGANSFIQNSASYNKVYFNYCEPQHSVSNGDVWENEITYKLNINL